MRIESVRYDASGDATIVASGGIVFLLPLRRIHEFAAMAAERLGIPFDAENPEPDKALLKDVIAAEVDFDPEDSLIQNIRRIDEEWRAEKKGFELCGRAEQSGRGLKAKLVSRGFSQGAAAAAVQSLEEAKAVDDLRFASLWARTRAERRFEGPTQISAALGARGLGQDAIRKALSSVDFDGLIPGAIEKESKRLARRLRESGDCAGKRFKEELYASLKAKGFNSSLLREELGL
ncbi:MAG TPA: RecX family transcriptional regulator [Spirochaetales bacterium]|nr:RecX family transcriptional regulator [Spirochaetales bacterium]